MSGWRILSITKICSRRCHDFNWVAAFHYLSEKLISRNTFSWKVWRIMFSYGVFHQILFGLLFDLVNYNLIWSFRHFDIICRRYGFWVVNYIANLSFFEPCSWPIKISCSRCIFEVFQLKLKAWAHCDIPFVIIIIFSISGCNYRWILIKWGTHHGFLPLIHWTTVLNYMGKLAAPEDLAGVSHWD